MCEWRGHGRLTCDDELIMNDDNEDNNNDDNDDDDDAYSPFYYLYYLCLSRFRQFLPGISSGVLMGTVKITSKIFHWRSYRDLIKISDVLLVNLKWYFMKIKIKTQRKVILFLFIQQTYPQT